PTNVVVAALPSGLCWDALMRAGAILAAFTIAWMLSGRIIRPVRQLEKDATVLAAGALDHRTAVHTNDEIGNLADAFNRMAASLEQRHEEAKCSSDEIRQAKDALAALIENAPVPI